MKLFNDLISYSKLFVNYIGNRTYLIFILTLLAGIAESFGLVMLIPLIQILFSEGMPADSTGQLMLEVINKILLFLGLENQTSGILLLIGISFFLKGLLLFLALGYAAILRADLLYELKAKLYVRYGQMSYEYYSSKDTGYFTNAINEQITRAVQAFKSFCRLGVQIVTAIIYMMVAIFISWKMGLFASVAGVLVLVLFKKLSESVKDMSRRTAKENGYLTDLLIQMLHGFKYLTATNQTKNTEEKVFASTKRLTRYHKRTGIANAFTQAIQEPVALLLILAIIFLQVSIFGDPLAPLLVSLVLFYRGINAAVGVQALWQGTLEFIGSMELVDEEFQNQIKNKDQNGNQKVKDFETISANNLIFRYRNKSSAASDAVISGISFEIKKNSVTAFVGESGAGKSTIIDLIAMIHKPSSGTLSIDGISTDKIDFTSWRRNIGYVSQDPVIFNDTIENNIALSSDISLSNSEVNESVKEAAKLAQIHEVIQDLPDKYKTIVGDRGMRLSGGQKQRLCIARELYRKPKILLLDEATSALDSESQNLIQMSLDTLKGLVTVIIISHRFSTIRSADNIFVLEHGKIVEEGSFKELQALKGGVFARMSDSQKIHE